MIKAVVFDLDETLMDRTAAFHKFCDYLIDKYAGEYPYDGSREELLGAMAEIDKGGYGGIRNFIPKLQSVWRLPITTEDFIRERNTVFGRLSVIMPGVHDVLPKLKQKYKLGIITNGYSSVQRDKISTIGIGSYFDDIIVSEEAGFGKPDSRIFQLSCSNLKVGPKEMVYVGDHYTNDIAGAAKAGIRPIWLLGMPPELLLKDEAYQDYVKHGGLVIKSLKELPGLL